MPVRCQMIINNVQNYLKRMILSNWEVFIFAIIDDFSVSGTNAIPYSFRWHCGTVVASWTTGQQVERSILRQGHDHDS